jgi:signal transduction histidine kinase
MFRRMERATDTGHGQRLWPVFAMLIAVVALPTAGVLWFMNEAMRNEQLAVRQRLMGVYRSQLKSAAGRIQASWQEKLSLLLQSKSQSSVPEAFASLVKSRYADSALFYKKGHLVYPELSVASRISAEPETPQWVEARSLEYKQNNPGAAAEVYRKIAGYGGQQAALAMMAQARCLNKAGRAQDAVNLLALAFADSRYKDAKDAQGRPILPNALLFALTLMKGAAHPLFQKTAELLVEHLNDYRIPMPSSQRRFLMQQLRELWPACPHFPTLAAEEIAVEFTTIKAAPEKPGRLQPTALADVWVYQTPDKTMLALFRQDRLLEFMRSAIEAQEATPGFRLSVHAPGVLKPAFLEGEIGEPFPAWKLALELEGPDPFESASNRRITTYIWTGVLMMAGVVMLSLLMARYLGRQIRLTRLKNDLIATVSHELKTPLASMRLLVDTLRDGHHQDAQLVQEYLQMISRENVRLSSLIEGFLTFSRMERNKAKFDREVVHTDEVVHAALQALANRLQAPGCRMELDLAPAMPPVIGDRDALTTVFVNLLDNALKYTGENKEIRLRGFASNGNVCFEVQDNGIGFPRSAAKKIFDRFYQLDRTLSRRTGGCGLGLSIVQFIVAAHHGSISAKSQPGKGSTFTIRLPATQ